jgi:hypothetical protein
LKVGFSIMKLPCASVPRLMWPVVPGITQLGKLGVGGMRFFKVVSNDAAT